MVYDPKVVEPKWQRHWEANETFKVEVEHSKPKVYVLDMFPYPSGAGLHVGHPEGYTATDIFARYKRMRGFNVLHPMGWDSYGLPAERYAMRTGVHPSITTAENVRTFRGQIKRLGFSYDWSREVATTDPDFIRWTQWIFLKLFERGLAYEAEAMVNWCPAQGTVLANEEVKDGKYVETGDPVERRRMRQWMLKITAFADRLLDDLDELDWPDGIKAMQRNWIGRSEGAEILFGVESSSLEFKVFSTRPETLWGATYCVLSPEHPLVEKVTAPNCQDAVQDYVARARQIGEHERTDQNRTKTGVFSGTYAINPATKEKIPIWLADYVLSSYGTGAIMAVPAHDSRDHDFAKRFALPIREVIAPGVVHDFQSTAWEGDGTLVNSPPIDGIMVGEARKHAIKWLESAGVGKPKVQYRLRDWLFSRQRYWGEPIPVLHLSGGSVVALPEDALPILPPELDDYKPTSDGRPPLARATNWTKTVDPRTGLPAMRETNTMPQWAGSCWYYLRFIDPHNRDALVDPVKERYWMPVDLYIGGAEHAVLHLLYARFWHKVLYDIGVVSTKEPFARLFNQGMILAHSYRDKLGRYYEPSQVQERAGKYYAGDSEVSQQIEKMSKSRYNVVNPDDAIEIHGADAVRLYEMFMGPLDVTKPWQTSGVAGVRRFLNRVWRLVCDESDNCDERRIDDREPAPDLQKLLHRTVRAVTEDIEGLRFNTAIARLMELVNVLTPMELIPRSAIERLLLLLSPFAPHICEELWQRLGHDNELAYSTWPPFDNELAREIRKEIAIQINGKLRQTLLVEDALQGDALVHAARNDAKIADLLGTKSIVKTIVVPGRLVNFVVGG